MEVEYHLTADDFAALTRYCDEHRLTPHGISYGRLTSWILLALFTLFSGVGVAGDVARGQLSGFTVIALGVTGLLLLQILSGKSLMAMSQRNRRRTAEMLSSSQRLAVTPEGFLTIGEFGMTILAWRSIDVIAVTPDHAFFFTSPGANSLRTGCVLPRRAFWSEQEFLAFVEAARGYQEAARAAAASPGGS